TWVIVLLAPVNLISARQRIGEVMLGKETVARLAVSAPVVERAGWLPAPVRQRCWKLLAMELVVAAVPAVTRTLRPPEKAVQAVQETVVVLAPTETLQGPF